MKLTILLSFFAFTASAQSIKKYITMYEEYCNELVPDTITQYGKVTKECYPVYNKDGTLTSYFCVNKDTTWLPVTCREFKDDRGIRFVNGTTVISGGYAWGSGVTFSRDGEGISIVSDKNKESQITRPHVCMVKRQSVEPFSWDFWNFIKTH